MSEEEAGRHYIATKIVYAVKKTRSEFHGVTESQYPEPGYAVTYSDGYVSWCPASAFERDNRPCDAMNFGLALEALKKGRRVARCGWNGRGQWLVLIHAGNAMHTSCAGGFRMQNCVGLKNAQGNMQPGWAPSQSDMLADDWFIVD